MNEKRVFYKGFCGNKKPVSEFISFNILKICQLFWYIHLLWMTVSDFKKRNKPFHIISKESKKIRNINKKVIVLIQKKKF